VSSSVALEYLLGLRRGDGSSGAVVWGMLGEASGHRWRRCSACGFEMLTREDRACPMVAAGVKACGGRMAEVAPRARPAHGQRPADEVCARPGCGRVRFITTAAGEKVCRVCLAELARATAPGEEDAEGRCGLGTG
jgi:hypothetical protein